VNTLLLIITIILAGLGGLLALGGVLFLLLKLGVIAHYFTKDDPVDESEGHTLSQSREAGQPTAAPRDEA